MTIGYIEYNRSNGNGADLRRCVNAFKSARDNLDDFRNIMTQMIDGDGSNSSQFGLLVTKFIFPDNASAKAAWDEINSALGNTSTAAVNQLYSKLG